MIYFMSSPSMLRPNWRERLSAISASAGTRTNIVGLKAAMSRNISFVLRFIKSALPV